MRKLTVISLLFLFSLPGFSQAPAFFKYQGVLSGTNGFPLANQNVAIKISILQSTATGSSVYEEVHTPKTNANGLFNLEIGNGSSKSGDLGQIDWGNGAYFVKIQTDTNSDNVFEDAGTTQLLSVPYALYAKNSGDNPWKKTSNNIYYSNGSVGIGTDLPMEALHINGNIRGNQNGAIRINTDYGYVDVGPKNSDYAHFYTNMPYGFYFNSSVTVRDHLIGYRSSDLNISTQSTSDYQPVKRITILNSNGNVGIAKTNPQYPLDVSGAVNATAYYLNGQPFGGAVWSLSGANAYYTAGNIGIGTTTPVEALTVNGNIRGGQAGGSVRVNTDYGYLDIGPKNPDYAHFYTNMPYGFYFNSSVTVRDHLIGYQGLDLNISTQSSSTFLPVKRITILTSNGNVGVGTTTPKSKLQVESGDVYLSTIGAGVIMKSPNGQCWRMTVSDAGAPVFTTITCP